MAAKSIIALDYEVFGRVQGVFFRKYTRAKAKELLIRGWVKNTKQDTVIGQLEGETSQIQLMKDWLTKQGSPHSRIDKCNFKNERNVDSYSFTDFKIS